MKTNITLIMLFFLSSLSCSKAKKERKTIEPSPSTAVDSYVPRNSYGQSSLDSDVDLENPYGEILVRGGTFSRRANLSMVEVTKNAILSNSGLQNDEDSVVSALGFLALDLDTSSQVDPISGVEVKVNIGTNDISEDTFGIILIHDAEDTNRTFYVRSSSLELNQNGAGENLVSLGSIVAGNFSVALVNGLNEALLARHFKLKPSNGIVTKEASIPVNTSTILAFIDADLSLGTIGGTLSITAPDMEDFLYYAVYWGSSSTEKLSSSTIGLVTANGSDRQATITSGTDIPDGATHLLVYTRNSNGEMASGVSIAVTDRAMPLNAAVSVAFTDGDTTAGQVSGAVTITRAGNETDVSHYALYWGSSSTIKQNDTAIVTIAKTAPSLTHTFAADTPIPGGATHLIVRTMKDGVEMTTGVNVVITDNSGPTYQRVFVTSTEYDGNLGGLDGADAKCNARASAAALGGTWKAILSDSNTSAKDRITIVGAVYNTGSVQVADNSADFWDTTIDTAVDYTETGSEAISSNLVWTGSVGNGTKASDHCLSWASNDSNDQGYIGSYEYTVDWLGGFTPPYYCNSMGSLFCIDGQ